MKMTVKNKDGEWEEIEYNDYPKDTSEPKSKSIYEEDKLFHEKFDTGKTFEETHPKLAAIFVFILGIFAAGNFYKKYILKLCAIIFDIILLILLTCININYQYFKNHGVQVEAYVKNVINLNTEYNNKSAYLTFTYNEQEYNVKYKITNNETYNTIYEHKGEIINAYIDDKNPNKILKVGNIDENKPTWPLVVATIIILIVLIIDIFKDANKFSDISFEIEAGGD